MYQNGNQLETPYYMLDEAKLIRNLELLKDISTRAGCKILLAQKAFSMYCVYPLIGTYLEGTTASSLFEARLGREEMGGEVHIFSSAYKEIEMEEIMSLCDHIVFNSLAQWNKYKGRIAEFNKTWKETSNIECGLRINPEYSEITTELYNPCAMYSRFGVRVEELSNEDLEGICGLHFHTMCEQDFDVLERTLERIEDKFGAYLYQMKWINFGGGHHITRDGYNCEALISCIKRFKEKYNVEVYLEPGEAVALNAGYLIAKVLELGFNSMNLAILDTSAACHMPDVLEMPYRPRIIGPFKENQLEIFFHQIKEGKLEEFTGPIKYAKEHGVLEYTYRLGGPTCLAGDVIGDYSFERPLEVGDTLVFCDMAIYSMVKNNTFNGINLPTIANLTKEGITIVKQFGYEDFKSRLS